MQGAGHQHVRQQQQLLPLQRHHRLQVAWRPQHQTTTTPTGKLTPKTAPALPLLIRLCRAGNGCC
jgi:hypothetical protein